MEISGKTAIVTGAASGIGLATMERAHELPAFDRFPPQA